MDYVHKLFNAYYIHIQVMQLNVHTHGTFINHVMWH